ncbi:MAG: efflux RND transporter permease subunit [Methylococcaceae bacterium]|nr:efflux RND transporter permease subunit [Methylococcaceae bacterium]
MTFAEGILSQPHTLISAAFAAILLGILGFQSIPTNLFPDTNRPVIAVVTQWPGAMTTDMSNDVTHPLEVRFTAIDGVRRVTSTSRDGVSSVMVEFEYDNEINIAANKVTTELSRVRGLLPRGVREPLIFKITDAARPLMVLSVTPGKDSGLDLAQVRRIAEHDLRDTLLNLPGVAEAEVFGGPVRQVSVDVDRNKLQAYNLTIQQVMMALLDSNISMPAGLVHRHDMRLLLTAQSLANDPHDIAEILLPVNGGHYIRIADVAQVHWGQADATSLYRGNGKEAVAVSLLRSEQGYAKTVISSINQNLANVKAKFPNLDIQVADTQGRIIDLTVDNMLDSLRDAVVMTLIIILLFLGNSRAALIVTLSLPLSYLLTFAILWWIDFEFDMVTLSGIIIAVGLLADDVVVVMENIERRMREFSEQGKVAAVRGLDEILLADTSGTVSTILVLVPIMLIGGFVETVLRPLCVTLSVALFASLVVSVTMIPLLAPRILKPGAKDPLAWILDPFTRYIMEPMKHGYLFLVSRALDHRLWVMGLFLVLFVISAAHMRLQGRELMPMMDTGIDTISFEASPDTDTDKMRQIVVQVETAIKQEFPTEWLISLSTVIGAEPGVKSFGSQRLLQQGEVTLNIVDRFHRNRSIYDINQGLRERLLTIPDLVSTNVRVFGATPLSSITANVDVMISGNDPKELSQLAGQVMQRLKTVHGLTGMERSWQDYSQRIKLAVDPAKARLYGLSPADVTQQVAQAVNGVDSGRIRVTGEDFIPVWTRLQPDQRMNKENIRAIAIKTPKGEVIPLESVAAPMLISAATAETHQYLQPTIDIKAWRRNVSITALHDEVAAVLADIKLPRGYQIHYEGEYKQLAETFTRLIKALALSMVLLYFMLVVTFRSFLDPVAIMLTLPLAVIGAAFGVLLGGKFMSMPAIMGLILLMGIVVNNGILLIDFAKQSMAEGLAIKPALLSAVEKRIRPILMTALSSAVGMIPLALEWAVGIERLSPLAFVAIGGLITGTFLTILAVPVLFYMIENMKAKYAEHKSA